MAYFDKVDPKPDFPSMEKKLLGEWDKKRIVKKYLDKNKCYRILELGTGSGAIAISLAFERSHWQIVATDFSENALGVAKKNAKLVGVQNVLWMKSNWFDAIMPHEKFDLILSNPPYIAKNDVHLIQEEIRFEPLTALVSDDSGLADIKKIIVQSKTFLNVGGCLVLEHGFDQGWAVKKLMQDVGFSSIFAKYNPIPSILAILSIFIISFSFVPPKDL